MKYDAVIVGAGPGGLHCAKILAQSGVRTAVLERNHRMGKKVCAGGITWGGLMNELPEQLIKKVFYEPTIRTVLQRNVLRCPEPIIATVDRLELGSFMAQQAQEAGADIYTGALVEHIDTGVVYYRCKEQSISLQYDYLIGADGSHSKVRSYLGIDRSATLMGLAMHYLVEHDSHEMVWNFNPWSFGSGYSWVFPHRNHVSAGAYLADSSISPLRLKKNLDNWLSEQKINTQNTRFEAQRIHLGFNGWSFGNCFLVGDAAGLASPLTGEGINPAIVSGEAAALTVLDNTYAALELDQLIKRHRKHWFMVKTASCNRVVSLFLSEFCSVLLRFKVISSKNFEMA